jgi:hypothetical protein
MYKGHLARSPYYQCAMMTATLEQFARDMYAFDFLRTKDAISKRTFAGRQGCADCVLVHKVVQKERAWGSSLIAFVDTFARIVLDRRVLSLNESSELLMKC